PAARLVDAQAPGLARRVRSLFGVASSSSTLGGAWPERLLQRLRPLPPPVPAYPRSAEPPDELPPAVRPLLRRAPRPEEPLATAPVITDRWQVLGWRIEEDERLRNQRVWLRGETSGRFALSLQFAPTAAPLDKSLYPGTTVDADLVFFPGVGPGVRAQ